MVYANDVRFQVQYCYLYHIFWLDISQIETCCSRDCFHDGRLMIGAEFHECEEAQELTDNIQQCLAAFQENAAVFNPKDVGPWYDNLSILTIASTGVFKGPEAIAEHLSLLGDGQPSLLREDCAVEGSFKVMMNSASRDGCSITVGNIGTAKLSPYIVREDKRNSSWLRYVNGNRVNISFVDGNLLIVDMTQFLPARLVSRVLDEVSSPRKMSELVCSSLELNCFDVFERNGFNSFDECVNAMLQLSPYVNNTAGTSTIDSNSTGCRVVNACLVEDNPKLHCSHLSYHPEEDTNGEFKCGHGYDRANKDLFTAEELRMFAQIGHEAGLPYQLVQAGLEDPGPQQCTPNFIGSSLKTVDSDAILGAESLDYGLCFDYLVRQKATSDYHMQYWLALVAMVVTFRVLAVYFLYTKLHHRSTPLVDTLKAKVGAVFPKKDPDN